VRIVAAEIEQMLAALSESVGLVHAVLFPVSLPEPVDVQAAGSPSPIE
jgi:hypothetical protein